MMKKEMIAMLLAGGQGSRLGVLTQKVAKPAVAFGGKYRIIDFPLSNCINSGIDTVGVLTQYQPLRLNTHIGIGIPWDLDRNEGGVTVLPPYEKSTNSEWYTGTANAIFQNLDYMQQYNPDYVLILSGDHIYKMDYEVMLNYHKANKADVTIACMPVPMEPSCRSCGSPRARPACTACRIRWPAKCTRSRGTPYACSCRPRRTWRSIRRVHPRRFCRHGGGA